MQCSAFPLGYWIPSLPTASNNPGLLPRPNTAAPTRPAFPVVARNSRRVRPRELRASVMVSFLAEPGADAKLRFVVGVARCDHSRPRRAGGPSHYRALTYETCAPLCASRRLAARAGPPHRAISSQRLDAPALIFKG